MEAGVHGLGEAGERARLRSLLPTSPGDRTLGLLVLPPKPSVPARTMPARKAASAAGFERGFLSPQCRHLGWKEQIKTKLGLLWED